VGSWNDITARKQIGEALVGAQDRIGRLLSSAPAVVYSYKATGDFAPTFVSENIRERLGYEPQEYLENADFWRSRVHPDERATVETEALHLFKKGAHTVEYRFLKKDDSYCWVNDEQRLIRDEEGQPVEVVGSWSDITERKRAEAALAAARARIEHLLSSSPLGYEREEYLHSPDFWQTRIHPQDSPRILRAYSRLFEEDRLSNEYRFRKKDGSYCWVSDELQVIRSAAGDPIEVVGAWSDITVRKQLGEALVATQERLVHLLCCAPAVIYSYKATGDFAPTFGAAEVWDDERSIALVATIRRRASRRRRSLTVPRSSSITVYSSKSARPTSSCAICVMSWPDASNSLSSVRRRRRFRHHSPTRANSGARSLGLRESMAGLP
jgi:adenylate cyclase